MYVAGVSMYMDDPPTPPIDFAFTHVTGSSKAGVIPKNRMASIA